MQITLILPAVEPCGAVRRLLDLARWNGRHGVETFVCVPPGVPAECPWPSLAVPVRPLDEPFIERAHDVLAFTDGTEAWAARLRRVALRVRIHLSVRRPAREDNLAHLRLAFSTWAARRVEADLGQPVVTVLPGVDRSAFRPMAVAKIWDALCLGSRRRYGKGTADVETAARLLGCRLGHLGGTPLDTQSLVRRYNASRIFVSACWQEGFNQCALEAMACGVPVVVTEDGGSADFARNEETALVVPPRDPVRLAAAMGRLLRDAELQARLRENGLRAVAAQFDLSQAGRRFLEVLRDAAHRRAHRRVAVATEPHRPRLRPRRVSPEALLQRWAALREERPLGPGRGPAESPVPPRPPGRRRLLRVRLYRVGGWLRGLVAGGQSGALRGARARRP